jgi:hypothetical protein
MATTIAETKYFKIFILYKKIGFTRNFSSLKSYFYELLLVIRILNFPFILDCKPNGPVITKSDYKVSLLFRTICWPINARASYANRHERCECPELKIRSGK